MNDFEEVDTRLPASKMLQRQKISGWLVLLELSVAVLVGQYDEHLAQNFPWQFSMGVGIIGTIFLLLFIIDLFRWIKAKLTRQMD